MADRSSTTPRPIADNSTNWPSLAALLAPAADCDCQVLAMTITERMTRDSQARPLKR